MALALNGEVASVARTRARESGERVFYTLSQGTWVRIFVAMPAMVGEDIIGVVYISRTPNHIFRFLYRERWNLVQAAAFVLLSTGLIGFVFWRFVTRPIRALIRRTDAMAGTARWDPLEHYGTREIETLAYSFQALTERLHRQRDALTTYTAHVSHEMKSPLTSIKGAAELMQDDMPPEQRARFLENIRNDSARMVDLLARMRDYSAVGEASLRCECVVAEVVPLVDGLTVEISPLGATAPMPGDMLAMALTHLLGSAAEHGATDVRIVVDANGITVEDDGTGISDGNRDRVFEPFFTTRRSECGTGMGLNIVRSAVEAAGGTIELQPSERGARFRITFRG